MKCEDCLILIEEYFDNELDARQGREVETHMGGCATCGEYYRSLGQEQNVYAHYRRDVDVSPALWAAIQASIRSDTVQSERTLPAEVESTGIFDRARRFWSETFGAPRFSPALAALLVIIAVGATVAVMKFLDKPSPQQPMVAEQDHKKAGSPGDENSNSSQQAKVKPEPEPTVPSPVPARKEEKEFAAQPVASPDVQRPRTSVPKEQLASGSNVTAEKLLRDAEQKYLAAITILQRNYNKRRPQLDAALVARLDTALNSIDNTIAETKKAMRQNPDDPIALQYMLSAYAKKVEVLRDVTTD